RMIVRRAAESAQADGVISRISPQEVCTQRVCAGELHAGILVDLQQTVFYSSIRQFAILEFRRVLRSRGEEFAVRTVVKIEQLLLVAAQRADITHAEHGVPADVMLHLETETLNTGDVSLRISGYYARGPERDFPRADGGEVTEVDGRILKQRRLADS